MLEAAKDRIFVGPAIGLPVNAVEANSRPGGDTGLRLHWERCLQESMRVYAEMRRRGVRVVIGGDYGFGVTPQGTNARDIEYFVKLFGYSPAEALVAATRTGGEIMEMGNELGQVKPGFLADLLLVDGDPLADVRILQDASRLLMIMKDGQPHKLDRPAFARRLAAE
jgi:imidazolonepropionase-like amidohydrolase